MRIVLSGEKLTLEEVGAAALGGARVEIAPRARDRVRAARSLVERIAAGDTPTYGINTGFGTLAEVSIPKSDLRKLQRNLILSHAAGTGSPLPLHEVRALMLLRANVLSGGYSGIRETTLELLLEMLQRDVIPVVPEKGSVGASGDLAPLAHLALVLIGEGEAFFGGNRLPGRDALARAGLQPVVLEAKEGLALVNGTQAMQAVGTLALLEAERCARVADIAAAMTVEGLMGSHRPFLAAIHRIRGHEGQTRVAAELRALLAGSEINAAHQDEQCDKVQDPYSLRCAPQVHGAAGRSRSRPTPPPIIPWYSRRISTTSPPAPSSAVATSTVSRWHRHWTCSRSPARSCRPSRSGASSSSSIPPSPVCHRFSPATAGSTPAS